MLTGLHFASLSLDACFSYDHISHSSLPAMLTMHFIRCFKYKIKTPHSGKRYSVRVKSLTLTISYHRSILCTLITSILGTPGELAIIEYTHFVYPLKQHWVYSVTTTGYKD